MAGIHSQIDGMEAALPDTVRGDQRREVIGTYAAIVGGLILARAVDDQSLSEEVLGETHEWLDHDA